MVAACFCTVPVSSLHCCTAASCSVLRASICRFASLNKDVSRVTFDCNCWTKALLLSVCPRVPAESSGDIVLVRLA